MTSGMYGDGVKVDLTAETKLNLLRNQRTKLEDQIEPKNNKGTKMNQPNKLGDQNDN